jgi:hypothetical protein
VRWVSVDAALASDINPKLALKTNFIRSDTTSNQGILCMVAS